MKIKNKRVSQFFSRPYLGIYLGFVVGGGKWGKK